MSTEMGRVLVAGATGYLGGFVAREFKNRGYYVRALARSPEKLGPSRDSLDEVVQAEITQPETLERVCDGIDVVFSSVGITKQKGKLTFKDVDYQGNRNLLEVAQRAGVKKFIYTSVFRGPSLLHLDIVKAHEDFVTVLKASGMEYTVVRPTGFFSDMGEYMKMAKKGRVYLIGKGDNRINPIHGADLAEGLRGRCRPGRRGDRRGRPRDSHPSGDRAARFEGCGEAGENYLGTGLDDAKSRIPHEDLQSASGRTPGILH